MDDLKTLYDKVLADNELKKAFARAVSEHKEEAFFQKLGCEATLEELKAFLKEQQNREGALSDDELESASGGCGNQKNPYDYISKNTESEKRNS